MVPAHPYPQTLEERLIFFGLAGTWALYVLGALYAAAPVLGWVLVIWLAFKWLVQTPQTPAQQRVFIPAGAWVWIIAMLIMQVALVAGHLNFDLGIGKLVKSSVGWAKGWALMAIFIVAGAALQIRPAVVYRAACLVGLQTLVLLPLFIAAPFLGLPEVLYTSPLKAIGGPGPEFFQVELYSRNAGSGALRWRFFAPWAPAAGFASIILLLLSIRDGDWRWRLTGCAGAIVMCVMCQSRLALLAMLVVSLATFALSRMRQPSMAWMAAAVCTVAGMAAPALLEAFEAFEERFTQARADSSRVRAALARIALHRWQTEAPVWGHGVVEPGPHLVEYMPIGSHHSWYGLLFVKGAVGFGALAVPMIWTTIEMLIRAQSSQTARTGLAVMLTLWLFTFGENLEIQVYMYWPGLVVIGIALREAWLRSMSNRA
jgi:hypothetical protein